MKIGEIRAKSIEELRTQVSKIREEHYSLRFRRVTDVIENPRQLRELRKDLARIETVIRERELGLPQAGAEAKAPAPKAAAPAPAAAPAKAKEAAKPKAKGHVSRSARKPVKATRAKAAKKPAGKAAPKAAKAKKTGRKSS